MDRVFYQQQIGSTNSWAMEAVESSQGPATNERALFLASEQTAGRGRGDNQWLAGAGALTFTLSVPQMFSSLESPTLLSLVPLAVGCGVCDAVDQLLAHLLEKEASDSMHSRTKIKWPNDIHLHGRKLGGVLVETSGKRWIIGCGLNVNNDVSQVANSISIHEPEVLSAPVSLCQFAINVVNSVLARLDALDPDEANDSLLKELRARDVLYGKRVRWVRGKDQLTAQASGISDDGGLILENASGSRIAYSGSIRPLSKLELDESRDFEN